MSEGTQVVARRRFTAEDRPLVALGLYSSFTAVVIVPLLLMLLWGVADGWRPPDIIPGAYTWHHWQTIIESGGIAIAVMKSLLIACVVVALTCILAFPTAWAMARFPFRLKRTLEVFILAPLIVPGIVVAVGLGKTFLTFGLAYSTAGVVLVQTIGTLPMMIRILSANLEGIPDDLLHAARNLGASKIQTFLHIVAPLSAPGRLAGGLLSFIGSFEEFDKSFIVGAPVVQTLPIKLYIYLDPVSVQLPLAAIVAFILLVPAVVVFVLAGRIMRDDLMAAGMGKV